MSCIFLDKMHENPQCLKLKIPQLLTISGKMKRSRKENRKLICLVCYKKKEALEQHKGRQKVDNQNRATPHSKL